MTSVSGPRQIKLMQSLHNLRMQYEANVPGTALAARGGREDVKPEPIWRVHDPKLCSDKVSEATVLDVHPSVRPISKLLRESLGRRAVLRRLVMEAEYLKPPLR